MIKPSFLVLAGPTASGKTEVACEIAKKLPVEVISCDSMQVYKGMPILTQAPSAKTARILRAHLVSFLDPSEEYDAAIFRRDACRGVAGDGYPSASAPIPPAVSWALGSASQFTLPVSSVTN